MLQLRIDIKKTTREIEQRLGNFKAEAPNVLVKSLNATARRMKKEMIPAAVQNRYNSPFRDIEIVKSTKMKNAKAGNLTAFLKAYSKSTALTKFPYNLYDDGLLTARIVSGEEKTVYKKVWKKGKSKPFVVQFKSGHVAIVRRVTKERFPIKETVAIPKAYMMGNKENYTMMRPEVMSELEKQITKQINKVLKKGGVV